MQEEHMEDKCVDCKYFDNRSALIESTFPGLNSLSSAYGSVWAESGVCSLNELFLSPWRRCKDFKHIGLDALP